MPEHDHFDTRLEAAVRTFADRAQTNVDAAAVAAKAVRARRHGPLAWLDASVPVPVPVLLVLVLLLVPVAWTLTGGAPWNRGQAVVPAVTASPSPTPTATPWPETDGSDDTGVGGTETVTGIPPSPTGSLVFDTVTTDPRTTGAGTWSYTWERHGAVGPAAGAYRTDGAAGAWTGTCRGSLSSDGSGTRSCWLAGSGAYDGFTCYLQAEWSAAGTGTVRGVIVPGTQPGS